MFSIIKHYIVFEGKSMNGKLALALLLLNLAALSIVATCSDPLLEDGPMDMDPMMTMSGIGPFPEDELNNLMLDMRDVPASANNQSIASLATSGVPVPIEDWSKTFGGTSDDYGLSVQETSDGGYVITGYTQSYGAGAHDVWLIKTDSAGTRLWDKTFGGTNYDYGYSVQETSDGGYVIAGYTNSYGSGTLDVWLIKADSAGTKLWDKTFGGTSDDYGYSVQETSDGGYVIAGRTCSYGAGGADVWLIKVKPRCRLYYPDFTDTNNPTSWRSWFVIQNPTAKTAKVHIVMRSRTGTLLYSGGTTIGPYSVGAIRPRKTVGSDCSGSAIVTSDQPLKAVCYINSNSNEMCMSYPAIGPE
jgi:hypothetical protein